MRGNHIFAPSGVSSRVERFGKTVGSLLVGRYVDHAHAQVFKFVANVMDLIIEMFISSSERTSDTKKERKYPTKAIKPYKVPESNSVKTETQHK